MLQTDRNFDVNRLTTLLTASAVCILLTGCGGGGNDNSSTDASATLASTSVRIDAAKATLAELASTGKAELLDSVAMLETALAAKTYGQFLIAGDVSESGSSDGVGSTARFNSPHGITADATGNLYVTDFGNRTIRKITPGGVVTTLAGTAGAMGTANGTGPAAQFMHPEGIVVDSAGTLFVSEFYTSHNQFSRQIAPDGVVTTSDRTFSCCGLAIDKAGTLYATNFNLNIISKYPLGSPTINLAGAYRGSAEVFADGVGLDARFNQPSGIVVGKKDQLYVADTYNHVIRKVTQAGVVTTIAGKPGVPGNSDGQGQAARFNLPTAVAMDFRGNLYVSDAGNFSIRKITSSGNVKTIVIHPALNEAVNGMVFTDKKTLVVTVGHGIVKLIVD